VNYPYGASIEDAYKKLQYDIYHVKNRSVSLYIATLIKRRSCLLHNLRNNNRYEILVTGGAGFIGSHIVDAYVKRGHNVVVIDNLSTGNRKNLNPKARFYQLILKIARCLFRFQKEKPQVVNHQAALASLRLATKEPEVLVDSNIAGTMNVLLASGRTKIKRFLFASSCSVLGHPKKLPATEATPIEPLSPYAYTKYANER